MPDKSPVGLYVHVPFCKSKCYYCDFASYAGRERDIPRYVDTLVMEIERRATETRHPAADTVFLGGGTPSVLSPDDITRVLGALRASFPIFPDAEITCECNPGTLTADFAQALLDAGANRLSIGAQTSRESLLRALGRIHNWEQVVSSAGIARKAGFENISLDLMLGLPGQTIRDVADTLDAALALEPKHLSCYGLIVEEGTPLSLGVASGALLLPDEGTEREMYEMARATLASRGLLQYEISNFALEGYECRHNIGCWTRVPYLGFGSAAHSFFRERRTANPSVLDSYLNGDAPVSGDISPEDARFESLMLGLRMTRGVSDERFREMHGLGIREAFGEKLAVPLFEGLLEWQDSALRLTRRGMDMLNRVLVSLM